MWADPNNAIDPSLACGTHWLYSFLFMTHTKMSAGIESGTWPAGFLECHLAGEVVRKNDKVPPIEKL